MHGCLSIFSPGECHTIGLASYQLHRLNHPVHENILLQRAKLITKICNKTRTKRLCTTNEIHVDQYLAAEFPKIGASESLVSPS